MEIHDVDGHDLYFKPRDSSRPCAYVWVDCLDRSLGANGGIPYGSFDDGSASLARWPIPALREGAANALLQKIEPYAERMCDGYTRTWDAEGARFIPHLTDDARAAQAEIAQLCAAPDKKDEIVAIDADVYLGRIMGSRAAQRAWLLIVPGSSEEAFAALHNHIGRFAKFEDGIDVIDGLWQHLRELRDEAVHRFAEEVRALCPDAQNDTSFDIFVLSRLNMGLMRAEEIAKAYDTWPKKKSP